MPVIIKVMLLYNNSKVSRVYNYHTYTSISIFRLKPEYKRVAEETDRELYKELIEFCIETEKLLKSVIQQFNNGLLDNQL